MKKGEKEGEERRVIREISSDEREGKEVMDTKWGWVVNTCE